MSTSDKVTKFDNLIRSLNKIIFGNENEDVTLDGVAKPTWSKWLKSKSSIIDNKADKLYVDNALGQFQSGSSKFYATLADANADIANIMPKIASDTIKDLINVGEVINGGTWYKASYGATSLTKSPYDPLTQAKGYTDQSVDNTQAHSIIVANAVNDVLCNLVDPAKCEIGYVGYTGEIISTASHISTGFIPVIASKNIQMWALKGQAAWVGRIAYYDINKKFIGYDEFNGNLSITSLAIPSLKNNRTPFYIRLSNSTTYHTGEDLYVGIAPDNPNRLVSFDLQRLFQDNKRVDEQIVKQIDNSKAVITAQNLLNNHMDNGTIGFLNNSFEPVTNAAFSKWWVTTDWIDIPENSTHLVVLGNIYSYTIKNSGNQWFSGKTFDNVPENVQTLIDLSKTSHNGTGIPEKIRLSFRRLDTDESTLKANETLSRCAIYAVRNSVGHIAESISLPSLTSDLLTLNTVQLSNLFSVCSERIYPLSSRSTGFVKGYYDQLNFVATGQYVESWRTSPYIVCVPNSEYGLVNNTAYSIVYFDASHVAISSEYFTTNKQKFTTPSNAVYLRISVSAANVSSCALYALPKVAIAQPIFAEKSTVVATKETLSALAAAPELSKLTDKKWLALGDSITNHWSSYANQLAARYNASLTKFTTDGTWVHAGTMAGIPRVLSTAILTAEFDNTVTDKVFDVITIACGVNDRFDDFDGHGVGFGKIGVMSDRSTDTFYGALHTIITTLRNRYPFARIGYITQIQASWQPYTRGNMSTLAYRKTQAILDVCGYYGVPVWIGCEQFGFNPRDNQILSDALMPDGLHPNDAGHTWYANRVEDFILNLAK